MKKRILSILLTVAMILTMAQPIFADGYVDDGIHSLITFAAAQYSVSEKDGSYEITVYREGNTQKAIDVALKAADFTAEYGKDYVVVIDNTELAKVEGISPEYSEFMETAQSAASYLVSEEIKGEATEEEAKQVLEALQKEAPENMPVVNAEGEIEELSQLGTQLMVKPSLQLLLLLFLPKQDKMQLIVLFP